MLDVLHKMNMGLAPLQLQIFFPKLRSIDEYQCDKYYAIRDFSMQSYSRHTRKLFIEQRVKPVPVRIGSLLQPFATCVVDTISMKLFQRNLQIGLLQHAELGSVGWQALYSAGWKQIPMTKLHELFLE